MLDTVTTTRTLSELHELTESAGMRLDCEAHKFLDGLMEFKITIIKSIYIYMHHIIVYLTNLLTSI